MPRDADRAPDGAVTAGATPRSLPRDVFRISNWRSATALTSNWLAVALLVAAAEAIGGWLAWLLAAFLIAGRMMAIVEVLGHDAAHNILFTPPRWNRRVEFLCFLPFGDTYSGYRAHHFRHHARLMRDGDPALEDFRRWGLYDGRRGFWWSCVVRPFSGLESLYDLHNFAVDLATDAHTRNRMLAFWLPVFAAITLAGGWGLFLWYWVVPLLWIKPGLEFWSEVSDHYGVPEGQTRTTGGMLNWLFLNAHGDGFHALHHRHPRIPCFQLHQAARALAGDAPPKPAGLPRVVAEVWRAKRATAAV